LQYIVRNVIRTNSEKTMQNDEIDLAAPAISRPHSR
jgi:hypothetical protein